MLNELAYLDRLSEPAGGLSFGLVTKTWGSAPRRAGSIMFLNKNGDHAGSLSGGCVESSVILESEDLVPGQKPLHLTFDVATDDAWSVGLACGGEISVHLQALEPEDIAVLRQAYSLLKARQSVCLVVNRETGRFTLEPSAESVRDIVLDETHDHFTIHVPAPMRLLIAGAVHITEHLCRIAAELDIPVDILDPRPAFHQSRRFHEARNLDLWPDDLPQEVIPDQSTAVVALSHDPKIDDRLLRVALDHDAFYIGALGSVKSHTKRMERLKNEGVSKADLDRIRGPVGLDIGAATPAEIALSIFSEIIATKRGKATSDRRQLKI